MIRDWAACPLSAVAAGGDGEVEEVLEGAGHGQGVDVDVVELGVGAGVEGRAVDVAEVGCGVGLALQGEEGGGGDQLQLHDGSQGRPVMCSQRCVVAMEWTVGTMRGGRIPTPAW